MLRNRPFQSRLLKTAISLTLLPKAVSLTKNRLPTTTTTTEKAESLTKPQTLPRSHYLRKGRKSHYVADVPKVSLSHAKADGLTMTKATFSLEQLRKFALYGLTKAKKSHTATKRRKVTLCHRATPRLPLPFARMGGKEPRVRHKNPQSCIACRTDRGFLRLTCVMTHQDSHTSLATIYLIAPNDVCLSAYHSACFSKCQGELCSVKGQ